MNKCTECNEPDCIGLQTCPQCGTKCHADQTIEDHGRCYDCNKARQYGENSMKPPHPINWNALGDDEDGCGPDGSYVDQ